MTIVINLMGHRFGRLTVLKRVENSNYGKAIWLCKCDCGNQKNILSNSLKSGRTKSCGCLSQPHGHKCQNQRNKTYTVWVGMNQRCHNSNHTAYKNYGGRGIKVCEKWMKFEGFLQDMGEKPEGLTLDRIDNNKGYCKENCRWATRKEQGQNTRKNILITINNVTKCLMEWCEIYQKPYHKVWERIYRGNWSIDKALELE